MREGSLRLPFLLPMMKRCFVLILAFVSSIAFSNPAKRLYEEIEKKHFVPKEVLYALALTESGISTTGRVFMPWPYTLNWLGISYRFNDKVKACSALKKILSVSTAVDIGESQLHWKYNKNMVSDACDYFDRETALTRSSHILNECHRKHGNWIKAAGCYHRPAGGKLAEEYERKYLKHLKKTLAKPW